MGIPDEVWGQRLCAVVKLESDINLDDLQSWCRVKLPSYKVPREFVFVKEIPRNAMGKVNKKELVKTLF